MHNFDIKRKPKPEGDAGARASRPIFSLQPAELKSELKKNSQPPVEPIARSLAAPAAPEKNTELARPESRPRRVFRKSFILVPFTIFVLVLGTVLGSRFVKLASTVSVGPGANVYSNISGAIGAVLGNELPALKGLDQSNLGQQIRGKQRVNILLLGYGGDGHSGAYLTDTMMVLSVNFANDTAAMISIPRDTWVQIPTNGTSGSYWKINAAYALGIDDRDYPHKLPQYAGAAGGGNLAIDQAEKVLGIPIDYFVAIDFDGFQKIVGDVGGVTIDVENTFTDYSYPESDQTADGAWCLDTGVQTTPQPSDCRYKEVHFDAGVQFMDGARALEYVRSRHAAGVEGTDFAREKRQQKLIAAIEQKMFTWNTVPKILQLAADIQGHFTTNMTLAEIDDLGAYVNKINLGNAAKISVNDNGLLVAGTSSDGQYILTPAAGLENFSAIQAYVQKVLNAGNP